MGQVRVHIAIGLVAMCMRLFSAGSKGVSCYVVKSPRKRVLKIDGRDYARLVYCIGVLLCKGSKVCD